MFKGVLNFLKSSNGKWILVIIVVLLVIWSLSSYSSSKGNVMDTMYTPTGMPLSNSGQMVQDASPTTATTTMPTAFPSPTVNSSTCGGGYSLAPVADPASLLPSDPNANQWAALNPTNMTNPIIPSLLQAGGLIGLDTIGQTLKNANLQLRSDPLIVKQTVGPWNNSTYEPNIGQVPLELGCGSP
jgi:hypothetical protein